MESNPLLIKKLKDALFSLNINNRPGYDEISFNVVKKASVNYVGDPVKLRSDLSLQKWIYPDDLNFARATSVFIGSDSSELEKYRPENKVLDSSLIGHSTDHAIIQLFNQTLKKAFENNRHKAGVFMDLSKTFDTVDHIVLLRNRELYIVKGNNHD